MAEFCQGLRKDLRFGFCPLRVEQDLYLFGHAWRLVRCFCLSWLYKWFFPGWRQVVFQGLLSLVILQGHTLAAIGLPLVEFQKSPSSSEAIETPYFCTPGKFKARTWEYTPGRGKSSYNPSFIKFQELILSVLLKCFNFDDVLQVEPATGWPSISGWLFCCW